ADKMTESMRRTIEETERRRAKQQAYNLAHGITPTQIKRDRGDVMRQTAVIDIHDAGGRRAYVEPEGLSLAADPVVKYMSAEQLQRNVELLESQMRKAAKEMDYITAAQLRDELFIMRKLLEERSVQDPSANDRSRG
ncbi:MAG TPA: UvrB/UvrC motif-containing protein, partial [Flavobacteriales bacterium]|nr:UvrB/UvrC motif-containing protein [Flavobacteriales bacterium]